LEAGQLRGEVPREEFRDAIDWMLGQTLEHVAQIRLDVQAVELRGSCRAPDYAE